MTATPPPGAHGPDQGSQVPPEHAGQQSWPGQQQPPQQWPAQHQQVPQQQWPAQQQAPQQQWPDQQVRQQQPPQQQWPDQQQYPQQQGWQQAPPAQHQYVHQPATGAYGYQYGAMPHYPAPQFPAPTQPQRGLPRWMWAVLTVLVIALVAVFTVPLALDRTATGPTQDPTDPVTTQPPDDGYGQPNTSASGTFTGSHMFSAMNEALSNRDRGAFFRFVDEDALPALNLWWDNMDVLQWSVGAISPAPGQPDAYADDTISLRITLGGATAGSPVIPADSDHPDAGMTYAPSNLYIATVRVTDDGESGVITGWEPQGTAAPWDIAPLYAVVTEHAITAGYADEQPLIDRIAPLGETGADWVIGQFQTATGVANTDRFTMFVTEDNGRFNDWFIGETEGWVAERAGTMFPQRRPYANDSVLPSIAVGGPRSNAGGVLTVGPNGLMYGDDDTLATIVHEFVHAMHFTNVPEASHPGSPVSEGFAVYNEGLFMGQGEFAKPGTYIRRVIDRCLEQNPFDGQFPTQDDFTPVETVHCAYMLSGSMYAYAASLGVDPYEAADRSLEDGTLLPDTIQAMGGPVLDPAAWWSWVESSYGS